jgi:cell wall-associated NlpC family hydrolase
MHLPFRLSFLALLGASLLSACGAARSLGTPAARRGEAPSAEVQQVIQTARSYEGTPYRYGGLTRSGMDCSGLVYTSFQAVGKTLPRSSAAMAQTGREVKLSELRPGHLVFFSTGSSSRINHVGLVLRVEAGDVEFIHASTSRGVVVNRLSEKYYSERFRKAVEVI